MKASGGTIATGPAPPAAAATLTHDAPRRRRHRRLAGYAAYTWSELRAATPALSAEDATRPALAPRRRRRRRTARRCARGAGRSAAAVARQYRSSRRRCSTRSSRASRPRRRRPARLRARRARGAPSGCCSPSATATRRWRGSAHAHAPRWVGDEQRVELCLACAGIMPRLFSRRAPGGRRGRAALKFRTVEVLEILVRLFSPQSGGRRMGGDVVDFAGGSVTSGSGAERVEDPRENRARRPHDDASSTGRAARREAKAFELSSRPST